jgi:prepilin-type processing-associated H-X9-DG protein
MAKLTKKQLTTLQELRTPGAHIWMADGHAYLQMPGEALPRLVHARTFAGLKAAGLLKEVDDGKKIVVVS